MNELLTDNFCCGYISTFILPFDFCKKENFNHTLRIDRQDLQTIKGFIKERIVPADASCLKLRENNNCMKGMDHDNIRAMCNCFNLDDHFLKSPQIDSRFYSERYLLHTFPIKDEVFKGALASLVLIVYYNMNSACLLLNTHIDGKESHKYSADDCLRLQQILEYEQGESLISEDKLSHRHKKKIEEEILNFRERYAIEHCDINYSEKYFPFKSFIKDYIKYIRLTFESQFNVSGKNLHLTDKKFRHKSIFIQPAIYSQHILELKSIFQRGEQGEIIPLNDISCATEQHSQELYALLTHDEGWRFVPKELADKRINNSWNTRAFFHASIYGNSILCINLKSEQYKSSQIHELNHIFPWNTPQEISEHPKTRYFQMKPCFAGLDHGILYTACKAEVIYSEINNSLKMANVSLRDSNIFNVLQRLAIKRGEATQLVISSYIGTNEIDEMTLMIFKEKKIISSIEDLKYKINLQGEVLSFLYQRESNNAISMLTWLTIILSVTIGMFSLSEVDYFSNIERIFEKTPQSLSELSLIIKYLISILINIGIVLLLYQYSRFMAKRRANKKFREH